MEKSKWYLAPAAVLWLALSLACWLLPEKDISEAERRPLAKLETVTPASILDGSFMDAFTDAAVDQFPLRQTFRSIKSRFHTGILGQKDNNGIYFADGYAVKQEYPLNTESLAHAADRFGWLWGNYLADSGCRAYMAIVPDKGYYLAQEAGQLTLDQQALQTYFREAMPWAEHIDLTDALSRQDYYRTDIHWRQEQLLKAARKLCDAMGTAAPEAEDYTVTMLEKPFYGVYSGQAALPMEADALRILESELLAGSTVYDHETGKTGAVYDMAALESLDLYDVFLSGAKSLLTVENPAGEPGRELVIFRDSFGSSIAPLLLQGYSRVTLVDIRYIQPQILNRFLSFEGCDVLFLYSTPVLNNSSTIK